MPRSRRRVYGAAAAFYVGLFLLLIWPIYPRFADARPFVLGLPMSLVYVVGAVLAGFLGLVGVFLWEDRRGDGGRRAGDEPDGGDERGDRDRLGGERLDERTRRPGAS